MPGFDKTGPSGQGAMTGRRLGHCSGGFRRGCSRGFGRGLGLGYRNQVNLTSEEEKKILEAELKEIGLEKQEIEKRLKEIK